MNAPLPHHLAAVWFADIVGYTAQSDSDEAVAQRLVQMFATTTKEVATRYGGRVVKFLGDGALVEFPSTELAVRSAWALTSGFPGVAESGGLGERRLRIGVHVGDVAQGSDGDLFGDGVNVASRLQGMADAGEVWVSDDVRRQLRQRREFAFESRGARAMKGFDRPIEIHAVEVMGEEDWVPVVPREVGSRPQGAPKSVPWFHQLPRSVLLAGAVGLVLLLGVGAWWLSRDSGASPPNVPADPSAATAVVSPDRSIAVLPFENLSPDPNDAFFAAGITDDILSALAKIPEMVVISRTSTAQYEGTTKPVSQIAEELGVGNVLEGSVRRAGNRIRIVVQLIDAKSDRHVWTQTYDRELTDVFAVQSEIAGSVAKSLDIALSPESSARMADAETRDLEAYALFLKGREGLNAAMDDYEHVTKRVRDAMRLLQQATDRDPAYAAAWAGLGMGYALLAYTEDVQWADSSEAMATKAIALDSTSSQAYVSLAYAAGYVRGRSQLGIEYARRAVSLRANNPDALSVLRNLLWFTGRFDEALPLALRVVRLEPTLIENYEMVAANYTNLELYEEAEAWSRRMIALDPHIGVGHAYLADIRFLQGDETGAAREMKAAKSLSPDDATVLYTSMLHDARRGDFLVARQALETLAAGTAEEFTDTALLGYFYERTGDVERAETLYREKEQSDRRLVEEGTDDPMTYVELARLATIRGNPEEAADRLDEAYRYGFRNLVILGLDPVLGKLGNHPRYKHFTRRIEDDVARMRARVISRAETPD